MMTTVGFVFAKAAAAEKLKTKATDKARAVILFILLLCLHVEISSILNRRVVGVR